MKKIIVLCFAVISNIAYSEKTYFYSINSEVILKIVIPDTIDIDEAIIIYNNQIRIRRGVFIQLIPHPPNVELTPHFEKLEDEISYFLSQWLQEESHEPVESVDEPLCYMAPMYEGPASFLISNVGGAITCYPTTLPCLFSCNKLIPYNTGTTNHYRKEHNEVYQRIKDKCELGFECPYCRTTIISFYSLGKHIRRLHPNKSYLDYLYY